LKTHDRKIGYNIEPTGNDEYRSRSPETIIKIIETKKVNGTYRQKASDETKLKQSLAKKGTKQSPESIAKKVASKTGKPGPKGTPKSREKQSLAKSKNPVLQCDINWNIIKEWRNIQYAADKLGIQHTAIRRVCKGEQLSGMYKGFRWRYKDDGLHNNQKPKEPKVITDERKELLRYKAQIYRELNKEKIQERRSKNRAAEIEREKIYRKQRRKGIYVAKRKMK